VDLLDRLRIVLVVLVFVFLAAALALSGNRRRTLIRWGIGLVIADASLAHSPVAEEYQERILNDGSRWEVYKRFFTGEGLAAELGGGRVLHEGRWFVVVASP
jgi:hypothetical protein